MKILHSFNFEISRSEANFDRACDEAFSVALVRLGADDDGYLANVPDWQRSTDHIKVTFVSMESIGSMGGRMHYYYFSCQVVRE